MRHDATRSQSGATVQAEDARHDKTSVIHAVRIGCSLSDHSAIALSTTNYMAGSTCCWIVAVGQQAVNRLITAVAEQAANPQHGALQRAIERSMSYALALV